MKWLILLLLTVAVAAQQITITGTVQDINGTVYANGSGRAVLVPGSTQFSFGNSPVPSTVPISNLTSAGTFSIQLYRTDTLSWNGFSTPPLWQFSFCNSGGTICFTMTPIALTSPQDITSQIQSQATILPNTLNNTGNTTILATNYGVKADTRVVWDATITNASQTVTCPANDCNFTSADLGKIVFGTNAANGGYTGQITSVVILPQGTITAINSAQSIQVSLAATASSTVGGGVLIWGHDDTTFLANAWTATVASCSTLRLPGINPATTGPAMMLIQAASFNTPQAASGTGDNPSCSLGTGGNRRGVGLTGTGVNSTYIIPTPNFNFSTCTFGASAHACLFTTFDGVNLSNFNLWGAGNSNPGSVSSDYVTEINSAAIAFTPTSGNSTINNVTFQGWGTNASGTGFKACIRFDGGVVSTSFLTEDGCGQVGIEANNLLVINNITAFDNMGANLYVTAGANVFSNSNYYCCTGQGGGADTNVAVFGTYYSDNDVYGATTFAGTALSASNGITVGYFNPGAGTITGSGGIAHINNAVVNVAGNAGNGNGIFVCGTQGGTCPGANTLYLSNSSVNIGNSRPPLTLYGNYIDLGGNTFNGTPTIAATGKIFGSNSIMGTTLATVATTSGWGTSPSVGSLAGNSIDGQFTVTVGTTPGANPVATVTFPTTFLGAPTCAASQIGGTQASAFVTVGTVTTTSLPITWVGTPTAANTIQIHYHCWN